MVLPIVGLDIGAISSGNSSALVRVPTNHFRINHKKINLSEEVHDDINLGEEDHLLFILTAYLQHMQLTFSKEIIDQYNLIGYGLLNQCRLYKVYKEDILLGKFFCADEVVLFAYDEEDFRIDIERKVWKPSKYTIINQKDNSSTGSFEIKNVDYSHNYIGQLCIGKQLFYSKPLMPDVKEHVNFFSTVAWGHYKLKVFSDLEQVVYSIKIDLPWGTKFREDLFPGEGKIKTSSGNLFLVFSGLFLLEEFLWRGSKRGIFDWE